jgi:putative ABC transport system permease protein
VALFVLFNSVGEGLNDFIDERASETHLTRYSEMAKILDGWLMVLNVILVIILAVAVANTMLIAVSERNREIGTLKALGFTRKQIRELILLEAMTLTTIAFVIGCAVGIGLSLVSDYLFWQTTSQQEGLSWFFAPAKITPGLLAWAAFISIIIGTLAALYPAVRASALQPQEALRNE